MDSERETEANVSTEVEFTCHAQDLVHGMDIVKRTLGSGKNMPILAGVRMRIGNERLELTSTDLETTTTCEIPIINSKSPSTLVLKGDVLAKITKRLPADGEVQVASSPEESQKVVVSSEGITFDLFQMPVEDYPSISEPPKDSLCSIGKSTFREAVKHTTFAALKSKEATRLSLTGVNTIFGEGRLKLVATNGYRMAIKTISIEDEEVEGTFLIEAGALSEWDRILSLTDAEQIQLAIQESEIFFSAGDVTFSDKLIMEDFPEFEGVIPHDNDLPVQVDRARFAETLRRAQITASEESGAVSLATKEGQEELRVFSSSPEKGEFEEVIPLKKKCKGDIEISFKGDFLIDALKRMKEATVTLWLSDSDTAGLLEPSREGDETGFIYVCMPISQGQ